LFWLSYALLKSACFKQFGGVWVVAEPEWSLTRDFRYVAVRTTFRPLIFATRIASGPGYLSIGLLIMQLSHLPVEGGAVAAMPGFMLHQGVFSSNPSDCSYRLQRIDSRHSFRLQDGSRIQTWRRCWRVLYRQWIFLSLLCDMQMRWIYA
jgi:hypothetical protein